MKSKPHSIVSLIAVLVLSQLFLLAQQIPCQGVQGDWTDSYQYDWTLGQNGNSIGGSVSIFSCPEVYWTAGGSINSSNGQFTITAVQPYPYSQVPECTSPYFTYVGSLNPPGCEIGGGTWSNPTGSGNFGWEKPCDYPATESTTTNQWTPSAPTAHRFTATVHRDYYYFGGRTVTEETAPSPPGVDTCYFPGSQFSANTTVQNPSGGVVNWSQEYQDDVGWIPDAVTYYRQQGRAPCHFYIYQQMLIACNAYGSATSFKVNELYGEINNPYVVACRDGICASTNWP
jgi:hypothetical protein